MPNASRYKVSIDMTSAVAVVYRQPVVPTSRQRRKCKTLSVLRDLTKLFYAVIRASRSFVQVCTSTSITSFDGLVSHHVRAPFI